MNDDVMTLSEARDEERRCERMIRETWGDRVTHASLRWARTVIALYAEIERLRAAAPKPRTDAEGWDANGAPTR